MPVGNVTWWGAVPDEDTFKTFLAHVNAITSEERDVFDVIGSHWETCLESEKVIIMENNVYCATVKDKLLSLVPDNAVDMKRLIWMWDAERLSITQLSLQCVKQAMML